MSHHTFPAVVLVSTAIDALAAASVLFFGPPDGGGEAGRRIDGRRLLRAAAVTGLVFLLKLVPLSLAGLARFGMIHLLYADLTLLVPSISLGLLLASSRAVAGPHAVALTTAPRLIALLSLGLVPVGIYATWVEPFRLRVEGARVGLAAVRDGSEPLRIGVLTDLQTARVTDYERGAVARLMALKPDLILMPGDLFQGSPADFAANRESLRDLLSRLSAPGGVFFVLGDTDRHGSSLEELLRSVDIHLVIDDVVRLSLKGRSISLGGVELDFSSPAAREVVRELETAPGDGDIRIVLGHRPDVALGLGAGSRIDLVVAGHTHGGQVVIPGFGPPMTLSHVPRTVAAGGLHEIAGNRIYVSRGVGCERGQAPRIRFFCPPEVSLLELADEARPGASAERSDTAATRRAPGT